MDNEHPLNPVDGPDNRKEKAPKKKEPSDTIPYLILMGIWALWFAMFSGDDSSSSYSSSSSSPYTPSSRPRTSSADSASSLSRSTSGSSPSVTKATPKPATYRSKQSGAWSTEPSTKTKPAVTGVDLKPCTVTDVIDGDTVVVRFPDGECVKIRLLGIDAPESDQAYGRESTNLLSSLISGRKIEVKGSEKDRYGRTLAHIYVDGIWVNRRMISRGLAWHYRGHSSNASLSSAESASRARHAGLWAESDALAPWDYRDGKRRAGAERKEKGVSKKQAPPKYQVHPWTVFVTKGKTTYHRKDCVHVDFTGAPLARSRAKRNYTACKRCKP